MIIFQEDYVDKRRSAIFIIKYFFSKIEYRKSSNVKMFNFKGFFSIFQYTITTESSEMIIYYNKNMHRI